MKFIGDNEIQSANIHGVPKNLSPVKKGKKASYFEEEMSNGSCRIHFVGFKAEHQKRLLPFTEKDEPVNYKIAKSKNIDKATIWKYS